MSRPLFRITFVVLLLAAASSTALAQDMIFQRNPQSSGYFSDLKEHPVAGYQIEAIDVQAPSTRQITRIEWWGSTGSNFFDAFRIRFFTSVLEGAEEIPGTLIYDTTVTGVTRQADQGFDLYGVDLPAVDELKIAAGETWWVSIAGANAYTGAPTSSEIFYWAVSGVLGYARQGGIGEPWLLSNFAGPSLRLYGVETTPTEASSWGQVKQLYR